MANDGRHHPSALRNRGPILDAMSDILPVDISGDALEIGSGSGCHVEYFSTRFGKLRWQPSEYVGAGDSAQRRTQAQTALGAIDIVGSNALANVLPAVGLDASAAWSDWPASVRDLEGRMVLVYFSNVTHISPWCVTAGALAGASQALSGGGYLVIYGPFKVNGRCIPQSNASFDASLRSQNSEWGYRDINDMEAEGEKHGLQLQERREMPANNFLLVFCKATPLGRATDSLKLSDARM